MAPGSMSLMSMVSIDTVYFIAIIKPRTEAPYKVHAMLTCLLVRRSFCMLVEGLLATMPAGEAGMVAIHVDVMLLQ